MSVDAAPHPVGQTGPTGGAEQAPTAEPTGAPVPAAGSMRRIFAHLIDLLLVAMCGTVVYLPTSSVVLAALIAAEVAIAIVLWEARSGRTIGKMFLGVRSAQLETSSAPGLRRQVIRAGLLGLSHLVALIGQFALIASSALDRTGKGQGLHDRLAATRVIDIRPGAVARPVKVRRSAFAPEGSSGAHPQPAAPRGYPQQGYGPAAAPGYPQQSYPQPVPPGYRQQSDGQAAAPGYPQPGHAWSGSPNYPQPGHAPQSHPEHGYPQPAPSGQQPQSSGYSPSAEASPAGSLRADGYGTPPPGQVPPVGGAAPAQPTEQSYHGAHAQPVSGDTFVPEETFFPTAATASPEVELQGLGRESADVRPGTGETSGSEGTAFVLTVDDGRSVTVSGSGLIGRNPQARPGEVVDELVAIDDPGRSLSRTHALFGVDGDRFWVEDRGSANGTVVVSADGITTRAFPGKKVPVPADGRVEIGERVVTVQMWQD